MDKVEVYRTLETFCTEGFLIEVRAISNRKKGEIWSGYFKEYDKVWDAIQRFDADYNIYFIFNVIDDSCYSMTQRDRMVLGAENTKDTDIIARNWVFIDIDPNRNHKKISSTDEEWQYARKKAHAVRNFLRDVGFSYPVVCSSGNGLHLLYKIDSWANTDENTAIINGFLKALSVMFSDDKAEIDTAVGNAARIDKLYGTIARKGANTPDRPHRLSRILHMPEDLKCTDKAYFKKVADMIPPDEVKVTSTYLRTGENFNIDDFIRKHNIKVHSENNINGIRKIILSECPFNASHTAPDSALFVYPSGVIGFKCFHNSCSQYTFKDFRLHFEPDAYDKRDLYEYQFKRRYYGFRKPEPEIVPETKEKGKKWFSMRDISYVDFSAMTAIPTGYESLDKKIMGLLLGDVTVMSGISGAGKTSWIDCTVLNAVQRGYKVALWSGELQSTRFKSWITQIAAGKSYVRKSPTYDNFYYTPENITAKVDDWLEGKLFLYNNDYGNKWHQLFDDIKTLVEEQGVQLVCLDNLMTLQLDGFDGDKNERQTKFINELKEYAKAKNIHIILVCHPRKESFFLRMESISGTADLTNLADNVIILHRVGRDFEHRAGEFFGPEKVSEYLKFSSVIEVCKNRSMGVKDFLVGMYYEEESRRLKNDWTENIIYGWQEQPEQVEMALKPNTEFDIDDFDDLPPSDFGM